MGEGVVAEESRVPASSTEQTRLLEAFTAVVQNGDVAGLQGMTRKKRGAVQRVASLVNTASSPASVLVIR